MCLGQARRAECASCEHTHMHVHPEAVSCALRMAHSPMTHRQAEGQQGGGMSTQARTLVYTDLPLPFRTRDPHSERHLNCPVLSFPTDGDLEGTEEG